MSKRNWPLRGAYAQRFAVLERDHFTCQCCGQYAPNVKLEVDHIIPVEDGGTDEPTNLRTTCYACNRGRAGLRVKIRRSKQREMVEIGHDFTQPWRQEQVIRLLGEHNGLSRTQVAIALGIKAEAAGMVLSRLARGLKVKKLKQGRTVYYQPA